MNFYNKADLPNEIVCLLGGWTYDQYVNAEAMETRFQIICTGNKLLLPVQKQL